MQLIDYRNPEPIFKQIAENFKLQILMGIYAPGDQLPSVRSLAVELSTNPNTVQKAYTFLEQEGFINTVKGKGNFVAKGKELIEIKKDEMAEKLRKLIHEAKSVGIDPLELYELAMEKDRLSYSGKDEIKKDDALSKRTELLREKDYTYKSGV